MEQETHDLVAEKQPMVKFTTPEQIGGLAVFYLVVSASLLLAARNRGAASPRPFAATLGELKKDHEELTR